MNPLRIAFPLILLFSVNTWADENPLTYDRINLSVTADRDVENDTLISVMYAQEEGNDPSGLSGKVNRRIATAVEMAGKRPAIRVQTLDYNTTPVYRNQVLTGWRVRQSIRLESRDAAAISGLIGDLQDQLGVSSITYTISSARQEKAENQLIQKAIAGFSQRAKMITKQMGRGSYRLVQMNVNTSGHSPRPYPMRSMEMARVADAAPPTLEAGTRRVEVRIDGTIELKP